MLKQIAEPEIPFPKVNYTSNYQSSIFTENYKPLPSKQFGPFRKQNQREAYNQL